MEERRVTQRKIIERVEYEPDPASRVVTEEEAALAAARTDRITDEIRARALREVETADRAAARARAAGRVALLFDFLFFLVYAVLGTRVVLTLIGARQDAPFAQWIWRVSEPLYLPFRGLLPNVTTESGFTIALPVLAALLAYALLHAGIRRLLRVFGARPLTV
jgi:uncharacterized protein YggT (Ycf19 family)